MLATAGGVLFMGGTNDRYFRAYDASNGKILWEFRTGSRVNGVPVSFEVDGKQYIAVQSGWGVDAARMQARLNVERPWEFPELPQGGLVWVFTPYNTTTSLIPQPNTNGAPSAKALSALLSRHSPGKRRTGYPAAVCVFADDRGHRTAARRS